LVPSIRYLAARVSQAQPEAVLVTTVTLAVGLLSSRLMRRLPNLLVALIAGSAFAFAIDPKGGELQLLGVVPAALPPLSIPSFSAGEFQKLFSLAVGIAALSVIQSIASAAAVARRSGQRLEPNRLLVGEGLSNIAGSFLSSYPTCNSFNRTMANY